MNARARCAHDPRRPRHEPSIALAVNAPAICRDVDARLGALWDQLEKFPELSGRSLAGPHRRVRARRSSRREAFLLVGRALMRRWDRRTSRCGRPRFDDDDTVDAPSIADLVKETGCSEPRVKRVLAEFHEAGYFTFHRVVMEYVGAGNGFCGLPTIRRATPLLLRRLRINDRKAARAAAAARRKFEEQREPPASAPGMRKVRRELRDTAAAAKAYQAPPPVPAPHIEAGDWELRLERQRLRGEHPDWGLEQLDAEARRLLGRPPRG